MAIGYPSSIMSAISGVNTKAHADSHLKGGRVHVDVCKTTVLSTAVNGENIPLTRLPANAKIVEIFRRGPASGGACIVSVGLWRPVDWVNSTQAQQNAAQISFRCIADNHDMNVLGGQGAGSLPMIAICTGTNTQWGAAAHAVWGSRQDAPLWVLADQATEPRPGTMFDVVCQIQSAGFTANRNYVFWVLYMIPGA